MTLEMQKALERELNASEIAANYAIDAERFRLTA